MATKIYISDIFLNPRIISYLAVYDALPFNMVGHFFSKLFPGAQQIGGGTGGYIFQSVVTMLWYDIFMTESFYNCLNKCSECNICSDKSSLSNTNP